MTPERQFSIIVGCMMGGIHGLILWTSYVSFSLASYILYGDINILPLATTGICDLAMVACVLLMNWWMPRFEESMILMIEANGRAQEDEDEL